MTEVCAAAEEKNAIDGDPCMMDGEAAKAEAIRDKIFGSKQAALQVGEKRVEMRETVETLLPREIMLR